MAEESQKQLLTRLGTICKHHRELSKLSGADFNVFKILKVAEDEVRHSAFLAELLNPKGSHGQGDVFLKIFVDKWKIRDFSCDTAEVVVEKPVGQVTELTGGQIDIFIEDKQRNCIIIENKIYADDQDNQLIRYYNFGKQYYRKQNLFYLTLKGVKPSKKSCLNEKLNIKLEVEKDYELKSYETDIKDWLELCHKESVSMPLLREGIAHYINLIKHLTGKSTNKAMSKDIIELLTENPTNLQNANELVSIWSEAKSKVQWTFWEALKVELDKRGIELEDLPNTVALNPTLVG
jgi:hypothetical protein